MAFDEKVVMRVDITDDEINKMTELAEHVGQILKIQEETQNG